MAQDDFFQRRYKHHIDLGGFGVRGQEALIQAKVLVVGTSGTAKPLLANLAGMGVGSLGIVRDGDLNAYDIPAGSFAGTEPGKSAVDAFARHLKEVYPGSKVETYHVLETANTPGIFQQYDLVVSATDNPAAALLVNDASVVYGIPFVYGAIQRYSGQVGVFNYKKGATLRCMDEDLLAKKDSGKAAGVLGVLPGLIAGYMAAEVVKIVSGIGDVLTGKLLTVDLLNNSHQVVRMTPNPANQQVKILSPEAYSFSNSTSPSAIRAITPHQLSLKLHYQESLQLIDIRDFQHWSAGHLENAVHVPQAEILHQLDRIHQDVPVILISDNRQSGKEISTLLNDKYGFGNIYYLDGGIDMLPESSMYKFAR